MRQKGAFGYRDEWPTLSGAKGADSSRQLHGSTRPPKAALCFDCAQHRSKHRELVERLTIKGFLLKKFIFFLTLINIMVKF